MYAVSLKLIARGNWRNMGVIFILFNLTFI